MTVLKWAGVALEWVGVLFPLWVPALAAWLDWRDWNDWRVRKR